MGEFPQLKSGAIAQYPLRRDVVGATRVLRFVDGGEQRFRNEATPLHRWVIRLDLLDEQEAAAIEAFFVSQQGQLGGFAFIDPWDGTEYPDCSLETDNVVLEYQGRARCRAILIVKENRV